SGARRHPHAGRAARRPGGGGGHHVRPRRGGRRQPVRQRAVRAVVAGVVRQRARSRPSRRADDRRRLRHLHAAPHAGRQPRRSGLDRGDRLTCQLLLRVMDRVGVAGPVAAALPVANQSGTLAPFFAGNPMAGRLRAKTGTLTGAKALTGFVPADDGHTLTFSFVYNGPNARESAASLWDRFGRALATYPYRPDLSAFAPAPATTTGG